MNSSRTVDPSKMVQIRDGQPLIKTIVRLLKCIFISDASINHA